MLFINTIETCLWEGDIPGARDVGNFRSLPLLNSRMQATVGLGLAAVSAGLIRNMADRIECSERNGWGHDLLRE